MVSFESDYIAGAHPEVLEQLIRTNLEPQPGYGGDVYCARAAEKIRSACQAPEAAVTFLVGGTQTNAVVISSMLHDYEGVVAAESGHVSTHEAGAIEYTGHKVLTVPQEKGLMDAEVLRTYLADFYDDANHEHMVYPGMVYISHPTEYGTLYTKAQLKALHAVCREYRIPLYVDGARLGYGLMSQQTDVTLPDLAASCDVFYIGGTKVGALCGEAVVFPQGKMPAHFMNAAKKRGALLAKGRLLGVQFDALFTEDLYFTLSNHAIEMAEALKEILRAHDLPFYLESPTNQQFVILENGVMERLKRQVAFSFWEKADETHMVVRFATSWSTTREDLVALDEALKAQMPA